MKKRKFAQATAEPGSTFNSDLLILDRFSRSDLRTWAKKGDLLNEFRVRQFYELESQRRLKERELIDSLQRNPGFSGNFTDWCRIVDYRWSDKPLDSTGSMIAGGRFNLGGPIDRAPHSPFPALYIAEDYRTSYIEKFLSPPSEKTELQPHELALRSSRSFTALSLKCSVNNLFDFRKQSSIKHFSEIIQTFSMSRDLKKLARELGIKPPYLFTTQASLFMHLRDNWAAFPAQLGIPANSQLFGRLLKLAGFDGILYQSTKSDGLCMAIFPESLVNSDTFVEICDASPPTTTITRLDSNTASQSFTRQPSI